jgi:hypothetical protein
MEPTRQRHVCGRLVVKPEWIDSPLEWRQSSLLVYTKGNWHLIFRIGDVEIVPPPQQDGLSL